MNFIEAIKTCFTKYGEFKGCASRPEYWWWFLFTIVGALSFGSISPQVAAAFNIAVLVPSVAVTTRRLHDVDRSGWWQLLGCVPILGWIVLLVWLTQASKPSSRFAVAQTAIA